MLLVNDKSKKPKLSTLLSKKKCFTSSLLFPFTNEQHAFFSGQHPIFYFDNVPDHF